MTGHVVARAARLLIVEVPRVFIVASNLLCSACQQQQQRQQHPQQLHSAGSVPFFCEWGCGHTDRTGVAQTSIGLLRVERFFFIILYFPAQFGKCFRLSLSLLIQLATAGNLLAAVQ